MVIGVPTRLELPLSIKMVSSGVKTKAAVYNQLPTWPEAISIDKYNLLNLVTGIYILFSRDYPRNR
jgi:hypothetical protein